MPNAETDLVTLDVRLPGAVRDQLEAAAAARGETARGLVQALIRGLLAEEDRRAPELSAVVGALRGAESNLRARGVRALWVSGPVARGGARPDSGVGLLCEFEEGARVSLVGLASLRAELSRLLDAPVDVHERNASPPGRARASAERDAVRAL